MSPETISPCHKKLFFPYKMHMDNPMWYVTISPWLSDLGQLATSCHLSLKKLPKHYLTVK